MTVAVVFTARFGERKFDSLACEIKRQEGEEEGKEGEIKEFNDTSRGDSGEYCMYGYFQARRPAVCLLCRPSGSAYYFRKPTARHSLVIFFHRHSRVSRSELEYRIAMLRFLAFLLRRAAGSKTALAGPDVINTTFRQYLPLLCGSWGSLSSAN